jgi:prepilin-type N-terminal cleavage/methylation domain-containing protein
MIASRPRPRGAASGRPAFTLVELLVVIGIIALLISILMPALRRARESANAVACSSNQRQIMMAFLMFANEHKGYLPGNWWDYANKDADKRAWLLNFQEPFANAPQNGTVFRYLNNLDVYRCPSMVNNPVSSNTGSNGRFDYASFLVFSGARVANVKATSEFRAGGRIQVVPTPVVCEEEPQGGINGGNNEGGHCNTDRMGHTHPNSGSQIVAGKRVPRGGGYYASIDGSVHFFVEPWENDSWSWFSKAPSGRMETLGSVPNPSWNYWNTR